MKKEELKQIAKLSRIQLSEEKLEEYTPQMGSILQAASVVQEATEKTSVKRFAPKISLSDLRDDIIESGFSQKEALSNAPYTETGYVKIYGELKDESGA